MPLTNLLLAAAFQVGPFYQQRPTEEAAALRPFWSCEGETTDVLWPLFTAHRDWWRFLFFTHYQSNDSGYQFDLMPLFWWGREEVTGEKVRGEGDGGYWGLFPLWGCHPHFLLMYDIDFALWPIWMRYSMPRPQEKRMMTTNSVLWPFVHWREDGSWGFWPLYVRNRQRASLHQAALWPIVTWASYEADRDTAGAGSSWMLWPLFGGVSREREDQWLFLPPFVSLANVWSASRPRSVMEPEMRLRCPWPFIEYETSVRRERFSIWPIYERVKLKAYGRRGGAAGIRALPDGRANTPDAPSETSSVHRIGWKLIELYDDETRVFPFWVSRADDSYFRLWPFWESVLGADGVRRGRFLSLFPIRNVPAVDRNWAKFWTFYENARAADHTDHAFLWGIVRWRTDCD